MLVIPGDGKLTLQFKHSAWNPVTEKNVPGNKDQEIDKLLEPLDEISMEGTIESTSADTNKVTIRNKEGKTLVYQLEKGAKIVINDKEAKLSDFKVGDKVEYQLKKVGDSESKTITRIEKKSSDDK